MKKSAKMPYAGITEFKGKKFIGVVVDRSEVTIILEGGLSISIDSRGKEWDPRMHITLYKREES